MMEYYYNLANYHYSRLPKKNKSSDDKEKYFKCWVNDMGEQLSKHRIDKHKLLNLLLQ